MKKELSNFLKVNSEGELITLDITREDGILHSHSKKWDSAVHFCICIDYAVKEGSKIWNIS